MLLSFYEGVITGEVLAGGACYPSFTDALVAVGAGAAGAMAVSSSLTGGDGCVSHAGFAAAWPLGTFSEKPYGMSCTEIRILKGGYRSWGWGAPPVRPLQDSDLCIGSSFPKSARCLLVARKTSKYMGNI